MDHNETPEASAELTKVKRVSAVMHVLINIGMAFTGISIAMTLIAIALAGSLRVDLGDGDFEIRPYRASDAVQQAQMLVVPHPEGRRDGVLYQEPLAVQSQGATVDLTPAMRGVLLLMALINGSVVLHLLGQVSRLFGHYQRGEIFSRAVVRTIRGTGIAVLAFSVVALFNSLGGSALVALVAPQLDFLDASINVNTLFAAVILLMVSWIMDEGRKLREDNELTI